MAEETPWPLGELRDLNPGMVTQQAIIKLMQILSGHPKAVKFECHICGEYREAPSFDPGVLQIKKPVCALVRKRCVQGQVPEFPADDDYGFVPGSLVWCPDAGGNPLRPAIVEPCLDGSMPHVIAPYRRAPHRDRFYFVTLMKLPDDVRRGGFIRGSGLHTMNVKFGSSEAGLSEDLHRDYEAFANQAVAHDLVTRLRLYSYTAQVAFGMTRPLHDDSPAVITNVTPKLSSTQFRAQRFSTSPKRKTLSALRIPSLLRRQSSTDDEVRAESDLPESRQHRRRSSTSIAEEAGNSSSEDRWSLELQEYRSWNVGEVGPIEPSMVTQEARSRFLLNISQVPEGVHFTCVLCGALRQTCSDDPGILVHNPRPTCEIAAGRPNCEEPPLPLPVTREFWFVPGSLVWYRSPETKTIWPAIVDDPPVGELRHKRPFGVPHKQSEYYITLIGPPGTLGGGFVKSKHLKHMSQIALQSPLLKLGPDMNVAAERACNALGLSLADRLKQFSIVALVGSSTPGSQQHVAIKWEAESPGPSLAAGAGVVDDVKGAIGRESKRRRLQP